MSAGGISYSAIVNSGKITLPSVEAGLGSMNMLRDPPKSYHTSRKNKVGETSSITEMIDESGNRSCEAIQVYARGVNPCVSVSYSNYGNNGGQQTAGGITPANQTAAKLPYTIIRDGAFRPPVRRQENLMPLSRLPRSWTSAYSKPGFADFSKKMRACGTAAETKEVHETKLKACVRPTAVYKVETPISEPFEVKHVIQPSTRVSASSGVRTMDITQQHVGNPTKEITVDPFHAYAQANRATSQNYVNHTEMDPNRFLQETNPHAVASNISTRRAEGNGDTEVHTAPFLQEWNHHTVNSGVSDYKRENPDTEMETGRYTQDMTNHTVLSNASSKFHQTPIDEVLDLSDLPVHLHTTKIAALAPMSGPERGGEFGEVQLDDRLAVEATTNIVDSANYKRVEYDNDLVLERNRPQPSLVSNIKGQGSAADQQLSRDFGLRQKISAGGMQPVPQIPTFDRAHNVQNQDSRKRDMYQQAAKSMQGRFGSAAPYK